MQERQMRGALFEKMGNASILGGVNDLNGRFTGRYAIPQTYEIGRNPRTHCNNRLFIFCMAWLNASFCYSYILAARSRQRAMTLKAFAAHHHYPSELNRSRLTSSNSGGFPKQRRCSQKR